jgi:hypothetical protein
MAKSHLKLVTPATKKRTVMPRRLPNADLRTREHLTEAEVERLRAKANRNRWGHRDATMILVAYRHGLRASELVVGIRWTSERPRYTSAGPSRARLAPIRYPVMSYELYGGFSATKNPSRHSCSRRSVGHPSAPQGSLAWSSARASRLGLGSRRTRTCSGTPADTRWQTRGMIRTPCRHILAIATSSTPCAILSCLRRGSGISGESDALARMFTATHTHKRR